MLVRVSGSINARSGTTDLLMMANLTFSAALVMMANWETSAEVPPVVGIQIRGGMGASTMSTPSNSTMCLLLEQTMPIPLAQSMGLPPPTAMMALQRSDW